VIAYFDSSAFVPLILDEPSSERVMRLWLQVDRVASVRLLYVESRAALARAHRQRRVEEGRFAEAVGLLEELYGDVDQIDVDESLVRQAGELSQREALRGYDAVHLAAAERLAGDDVLFVSGDRALCGAARRAGLQVSAL